MKSKKQLYALILASLMLLSSCGEKQSPEQQDAANQYPLIQDEKEPALFTPSPQPLPSLGETDWNDIPKVWEGTGGPNVSTWLDSRVYSTISMLNSEDFYENQQNGPYSESITTPYLTGLKNEEMQKEINQWLRDSIAHLRSKTSYLDRYVTEEVLACSDAGISTYVSSNHFISGNLLSLSVSRTDMIFAYDNEAEKLIENRLITTSLYRTYDMASGSEISLSDLFMDGTDLHSLLDPIIAEELASSEGEIDWGSFQTYGGLKRPYRGLPKNYSNFSLSESHLMIFFPPDNPYLSENYTVYIPLDLLKEYLAQPMSSCLPYVEEDLESYTSFRDFPSMVNTAKNHDMLYLFGDEQLAVRPYRLISEIEYPHADKINSYIGDIFTALHDAPLPEWLSDAKQDPESYCYADSAIISDRAFIQFHASVYAGRTGVSPIYQVIARMFDTETGEPVPLSDVLNDVEGAMNELRAMGLEIHDPSTHYGWYCFGPDGEIYVCAENGLSSTYTLPAGYFSTDILK